MRRIALPMTAQIRRDDPVAIREMRQLIFPRLSDPGEAVLKDYRGLNILRMQVDDAEMLSRKTSYRDPDSIQIEVQMCDGELVPADSSLHLAAS